MSRGPKPWLMRPENRSLRTLNRRRMPRVSSRVPRPLSRSAVACLVLAIAAWATVALSAFGLAIPWLGFGLLMTSLACGLFAVWEMNRSRQPVEGALQAIWGLALSGVLTIVAVLAPLALSWSDSMPEGVQEVAHQVQDMLRAVSYGEGASEPELPLDFELPRPADNPRAKASYQPPPPPRLDLPITPPPLELPEEPSRPSAEIIEQSI